MKKYPEHEKLKAVQSQSQVCGAFYEWLQFAKGIEMPVRQTISSLLAEFFEIDEDKLEKEKCTMLAECRAAYEKPRG